MGQRRHVVVTYTPGRRERAALEEVLGGEAALTFLGDLDPGARRARLASADALLALNPATELTPEELDGLDGVRLLQLVSAGADHVPFDAIPVAVPVASNAGAYAEPIAEHVIAMALALARRLPQGHAKLARGEFDQRTRLRTLKGAVLGVLGFGGIGRATARLARGIGMRVHALNRSGTTDEPVEWIGTAAELDTLLAAADVLVLSLPLNRLTRGLIGARELAVMKRDAILVNVARGDIVDEKALYEHLLAEPEFSAAIDTWWVEPFRHGTFTTAFPFLDLPNVLGSPHNSALVAGALEEGARAAARNVLRLFRGEAAEGLLHRDEYI